MHFCNPSVIADTPATEYAGARRPCRLVSIPTTISHQGRTWQYEVVEEIPKPNRRSARPGVWTLTLPAVRRANSFRKT